MRNTLSILVAGALSSLFLTTGQVEAAPPINGFNTTVPYYPEEYYAYHTAADIGLGNALINLEDGSQWKVADYDITQLLTWRPGDFLVITPNHGFSGYDYTFYITNQSNNSYVRVNLVTGPTIEGPYTMYVTGMDANSFYKRAVYLNNGTSWKIDDADFHGIEGWQVGDPIIIGRNDAWFTNHGTILINVTTNTFVRARKI